MTTQTTDTRPSLYVDPNIRVLNDLTELVDPRKAMVTVHRSGSIHVTAMGETFEQMRTHSLKVERLLVNAGYPVIRFSATLLYLTKEQCDAAPVPPTQRALVGDTVYDVLGDPADPADTGTVYAVRPGGYAVLWTGPGETPKFAAFDEVALLPIGQ